MGLQASSQVKLLLSCGLQRPSLSNATSRPRWQIACRKMARSCTRQPVRSLMCAIQSSAPFSGIAACHLGQTAGGASHVLISKHHNIDIEHSAMLLRGEGTVLFAEIIMFNPPDCGEMGARPPHRPVPPYAEPSPIAPHCHPRAQMTSPSEKRAFVLSFHAFQVYYQGTQWA